MSPGDKALAPYATGIAQDAPSPLTSVDATVNGLTTYHGTIFNGGADWLEGMRVAISGFGNTINNSTFIVDSSTATTLVVRTPVGMVSVPEVHAASALPRPYFTDLSVIPGQI